MRIARVTMAFVAFFGASQSLAAPVVSTNRNIRCLMLSNLYVNSAKDDQGRKAAQATRLFYLGRVDDGLTEAQLESTMLAEGKAITPATAGDEMNKCARTLEQRNAAITAIADRLRTKLAK